MDERMTRHRTDSGRQGMAAYMSMGVLIAFGAGAGIVIGLLVDQFVMGLAIGTGLGTLAGAVFESYRKR